MATTALRRACIPLLLLLAALLAASPPAPAQESPTAVVEGINAALLDVMKNADELGFEGRRERLEPVLTENFNFPQMARIAVGPQRWAELSEAERERLTEVFTRRSIADFAARFDGYGGERFEVLGEEPGQRGTVRVENRIVKSSGEPVPINYVLREFDGEWRVIDIVLDAKYSELARTRAEYASVLDRRGFEGLIQSLEDKIAQLRTDAGAELASGAGAG